MAALTLVSNVCPSIVRENERSCILLNGIDLPLANQRRNAMNLVVLLEVEERVDAESQVALDKIPDFASALHLALLFRICKHTAVDDPNAIRGKYKFADHV